METRATIDEADLLRAYLAMRDVSCPLCGYNLRGNQGVCCSECGCQLKITIGATVGIGPWVVALLATAFPLGACLLWSCLGLWANLTEPTVPGGWIVLAALTGLTVLYATILLLLIRKRQNFWRKARAWQVRISIYLLGFNIFLFTVTLTLIWTSF